MPSAAPPLAYRPGLDAVRSVAILLVVVGHWTQPRFPISLMGSMTFFVLSGYFISGIVWKQEVYVGAPGRWQQRLGVFYLRRLVRTLPPYYLSLALGFALPLVTLHQYPGWFLVPVSNLLFFRMQHWAEGVGHYWTLSVDEQFYVLWPILLAVLPRRVRWLAVVAGCGLLFRGTQTSNKTGKSQPVAFANFYGAVVPNALRELGLGDRGDEVNPNMARLGWNEAWENDEWWAKSPKPSLSL